MLEEQFPPNTKIRYWFSADGRVQREVTIPQMEEGVLIGVLTNQPKPTNALLAGESDYRAQVAADLKASDEAQASFEAFVAGQAERKKAKQEAITGELKKLGISDEVAAMIAGGSNAATGNK